MAYLQVFKIFTNVKKFSNIFIEKNLCKWTHTVQTYVGQGASAFVDEWIKEEDRMFGKIRLKKKVQ